MAATTYSVNQVMLSVANRVGLIKGSRVSAVQTANPYSITLQSGSTDTSTDYSGALVEILGKGINTATGYTPATKIMTFAANFTVNQAINDYASWAFWKGLDRILAQRAINEALDSLWPNWYRERCVTGQALTGTVAKSAASATLTGTSTLFTTELLVGDKITVPGTANETRTVTAIASDTSLTVDSAFTYAATGQTATFAAITLDDATFVYDLPANCVKLSQVGWVDASGYLHWYLADNIWRQTGVEGAAQVRFLTYPDGSAFPYSRDGDSLWLWYEAREPQITSEIAATQAHRDAFTAVAAQILVRNAIGSLADDLQNVGINLPQLQREAVEARGRLVKTRLPYREYRLP